MILKFVPRSQLNNDASLNNFINSLFSELSRYDEKLILQEIGSGKNPDLERLGQWYKSANVIKFKMSDSFESSETSTIMEFKALLINIFDETLPPIQAVLEKVELYLSHGIRPALSIKGASTKHYVVPHWNKAA